jgi:hypothetical protein
MRVTQVVDDRFGSSAVVAVSSWVSWYLRRWDAAARVADRQQATLLPSHAGPQSVVGSTDAAVGRDALNLAEHDG